MKKVLIFVTLVTLVAAVGCFAACGNEEANYNNIQCSAASVLYDGEQTVTLTSSTPYGEGEAALFKQSISASDITLKDALAGKTVSSVEFVSETEVKVTLAGTASRTPTGDGVADIGRIYVSSDALKTEGNAYCLTTVVKAELSLKGIQTKVSGGKTMIIETYTLNVGSFAPNADELISLKDADSCTLAVTINGSDIVFTVSDLKDGVKTVEVTVPAEATSLGEELTVTLEFDF